MNSENPNLKVWGDGSPTRDFLYVEDAAKVICKLIKSKETKSSEPINIGTGTEISIKNLIYLITKIFKYTGPIIFEKSKPNGQPRRVLDITRLENIIGNYKFLTINKGLENTINYYLKNKNLLIQNLRNISKLNVREK